MIEHIEIQNFKSIKRKHFPLRNLNVLLGLNGMGKSSFIQMFLVLRQSHMTDTGRLDLKGQYVNIGTTKDALYQYANVEPLKIDLKFSSVGLVSWVLDYKFESDVFRIQEDLAEEFKQVFLPRIRQAYNTESLLNNDFQYLNASRMEPKQITDKNYSRVVDRRDIGPKGENAGHYIDLFSNEKISIPSLAHPKSEFRDELTGNVSSNNTFINQVNLWMGEISPGVGIRTTSVNDYILIEYEFKQRNLGTTNRFKPENVGFGITYGLPVVVSLLKAKPGDLIIIENPESHIHPRGQVEIGRMIAIAAMAGVQIILETHSDHIVNGIRVAVKEKLIDPDKVVLFFFDKVVASEEQYSHITNIEIDANGELSEYPQNMLDEWSNQLLKLL